MSKYRTIVGLVNKSRVIDLCQAVPSYPMPPKMKQIIIDDFSDSLN